MKRADVKAGVVYAYRASKYDRIRPVLILDTGYWRRASRSIHHEKPEFEFVSHATLRQRYLDAGRDYKPDDRFAGGDQFPDCGLAGLDWDSSIAGRRGSNDLEGRDEAGKRLQRLARSQTVPKLLAAYAALKPGYRRFKRPADLRGHLFNPAWIIGDWDEVVSDVIDEEERRRIIEAEVKADSDDRVARAGKRVEALRALALPGEIPDAAEREVIRYGSRDWEPPVYRGNTDHVRLSMRQVDALLSLIPDGATWQADDVEEDGWTLRVPEYARDTDDDEDGLDDDPED